MEILHPASMQNFYRHLHVILQGRNKFCLNWTITERVMTLCRFFQMADIPLKYSFAFWFYDISPSGRQINICVSNFDLVSQSTAEILLLQVSENKRPPSWNSTSGFNFDPFTAIGMWFSIGIPNFIKIGLSAAELWRHGDFQDGGRQPCWIWFRAMVAHPRSAIGGLCFILKFRLDRIYSFGVRAIFIFWHFCLKLPIHAHF